MISHFNFEVFVFIFDDSFKSARAKFILICGQSRPYVYMLFRI